VNRKRVGGRVKLVQENEPNGDEVKLRCIPTSLWRRRSDFNLFSSRKEKPRVLPELFLAYHVRANPSTACDERDGIPPMSTFIPLRNTTA